MKNENDPKSEDSILADANSAAGAVAKNRFSRTECVLIQQLYIHGTSKSQASTNTGLFMDVLEQKPY